MLPSIENFPHLKDVLESWLSHPNCKLTSSTLPDEDLFTKVRRLTINNQYIIISTNPTGTWLDNNFQDQTIKGSLNDQQASTIREMFDKKRYRP